MEYLFYFLTHIKHIQHYISGKQKKYSQLFK